MQSIPKPILGLKRYEVSGAFVLNGARVIMIYRKEHQGQAALDKIKEEAGKDAKVEWVPCDMGSLSQVRETASHLVRKEERLDPLILSSSINTNQYSKTSDGIDRHFQVNWVGQFDLCNLL
ncbi:hypothetical protein AFLA_012334 [Aspergillus flavus NRRL3357]|nr:hypothetical protein AFLA_012334 [Aspergillus flavus NRRL3357]